MDILSPKLMLKNFQSFYHKLENCIGPPTCTVRSAVQQQKTHRKKIQGYNLYLQWR